MTRITGPDSYLLLLLLVLVLLLLLLYDYHFKIYGIFSAKTLLGCVVKLENKMLKFCFSSSEQEKKSCFRARKKY